jgi:hypothetical protein
MNPKRTRLAWRLATLATAVCLGTSHVYGQTTLYVDDDAPAGGDGSSWQTAYRFLQDALAAAAGGGTVTEIHVAQGVYTPDRDESNPDGVSDCCVPHGGTGCGDAGCEAMVCAAVPLCCAVGWDASCAAAAADLCGPCADARTATFQLLDGVALRGGYTGLGPGGLPDVRDTVLYETVLSGDLAGNDGPGAFENNDENSLHVVTGSGIVDTEATVLEGFTVSAGNANGPGWPEYGSIGAGMVNVTGSPTVTDCVFDFNRALDAGAGMSNVYDSDVIVTTCEFSDNVVDQAASPSTSGGMFNGFDSDAVVTGCVFQGNSAGDAGGMGNEECAPTVTGCEFTENQADVGGAVYNRMLTQGSRFGNCIFTDNSAGAGGGIYNYESSPKIEGCRFVGNTVTWEGGAIVNAFGASPEIVNCLFHENLSVNARGAIGNAVDAAPTILNCTITGNTGCGNHSNDGFGGHCTPIVSNCIVYGNTGGQIVDVLGATTTVTYSNVQGGWPGTGNIDVDPLFADPGGDDYRLSGGSPSIDAGHNWAIAGLADADLDGNPRFAADEADFDPGCGIPVVVDMGAYEYQGEPFPVKLGDLDGDGAVGVNDFLLLLAGWGGCVEDCCLADLDLDGDVGVADFLILLAEWG